MKRKIIVPMLLLAAFALGAAGPSEAATSAEIHVGLAPRGVAVDRASGRVFVANSGSDDVSVVDPLTNAEIDRVPVGDSPIEVAVNPSTHRAYVANRIGRSISVIDTDALAVVATIPLGRGAMDVDVNPTTNRIYVPLSEPGGVAVIDGASNQVVTTAGSGGCPPAFVAVDQVRNRVYSASADWSCSVSVLDGTTHQNSIAFSHNMYRTSLEVEDSTGRVFIGTNHADYVGLSIWDPAGTSSMFVKLPAGPSAIAIDSISRRVYMSGVAYPEEPAAVQVFDAARNLLLEAPTPSTTSRGIAVASGTGRVFLTSQNQHTLVVFEDHIPEPTIPSAPRDLIATPGPRAGEISLMWSSPASSGWTPIYGYSIRRGGTSGGDTHVAWADENTFTDTGLPTNGEYFYRVVAVNGMGEGPASDQASGRTLRVPSGECANGRAIFDGAVGPARMRLRLLTTGSDTAACFRIYADTTATGVPAVREYGAKVTLTPVSGSSAPEVDEDADACATTQGNESGTPPVTGHIGDPTAPAQRYDVRSYSRRDLGTWLCIKVWDDEVSVGRRIILRSTASSIIEPDPPETTPAPSGGTGSASGICRLRGGPELFSTETVDGGHIWLSTWNESETRRHVCVRRESPDGKAGGRITIDTKGAPGSTVDAFVSTYDDGEDPGLSDSRCPRSVYQVSYFGVAHSDPANPSHVCVGYPVASLFQEGLLGPTYFSQRVIVVTIGSESLAPPPEITWTPDE